MLALILYKFMIFQYISQYCDYHYINNVILFPITFSMTFPCDFISYDFFHDFISYNCLFDTHVKQNTTISKTEITMA